MIPLNNDAQNVVKDLKRIDPSLNVRISRSTGMIVVYAEDIQGKDYIVTTAEKLDKRLVKTVEQIKDVSYNLADEMEKAEKAAQEAKEKEISEQVGEYGERLAHAFRKDLGIKDDVSRASKKWGNK